MKIVNLKKFVRTIATILLISIFLLFLGLSSSYSKGEVIYKEEYIIKGETLWSIAEKESIENNYYKNKDIRDIVCHIKQINNLKNSNLKVGQKILIPTI